MKTYLIAEIGPNHNGSIELALQMIDRIAAIGVDAIKFQLAKPENVYSADSFKVAYQTANDKAKTPIEMSRRIQLPFEAHLKLRDACRERGVDYLCTAFDIESLAFLDTRCEPRYFKIPSGEIHTVDMMDYIARRDRPILLSTGMATWEDIAAALGLLTRHGEKDITILHCVSNYPAPPEDINLRAMTALARRFGRPVGYSDHSLGLECAVAAVALGAKVVEKHVTLDRAMEGPDHKASATVEEFAALVKSIRAVESALGSEEKIFSSAEEQIRRAVRKSVVTTRAIAAGEVLTRADFCFKRPGTGFSPLSADGLVGRRLKTAIEADRVLLPSHLE